MNFLITSEYLKENVHVEQQLDESLITVAFIEANRFYIQPLLKDELLAALLDDVLTKRVLTGKRKQLLADVQYYFAHRALHSLLGFYNVKTSNRGAVEPENGADLDRLQYLRSGVEAKCQTLAHDIELLIKLHPEAVPEYYTTGTSGEPVAAPATVRAYAGFIPQINRNKRISG